MAQKSGISDLMLEQYRLGELSAAQAQAVREELTRDQVLRERLAAIAASDEEIRASYPAARMVPLIEERARHAGAVGARGARRLLRPAWAIPIAATIVILLSLPIVLRPSGETRLKGLAAHLVVFRKTAGGAEELRAGAVAHKGDVLQLSYTAGGAKYGVIFSLDGRGTLTWHMPPGYSGGPRTSPPLEPQGPVVLPSAYELDDAPGFERFFLVYATSPFEVADVQRAARGLTDRRAAADQGSLPLPSGLGQSSLLIKKQG